MDPTEKIIIFLLVEDKPTGTKLNGGGCFSFLEAGKGNRLLVCPPPLMD
jgi:hypothetical protein